MGLNYWIKIKSGDMVRLTDREFEERSLEMRDNNDVHLDDLFVEVIGSQERKLRCTYKVANGEDYEVKTYFLLGHEIYHLFRAFCRDKLPKDLRKMLDVHEFSERL